MKAKRKKMKRKKRSERREEKKEKDEVCGGRENKEKRLYTMVRDGGAWQC